MEELLLSLSKTIENEANISVFKGKNYHSDAVKIFCAVGYLKLGYSQREISKFLKKNPQMVQYYVKCHTNLYGRNIKYTLLFNRVKEKISM